MPKIGAPISLEKRLELIESSSAEFAEKAGAISDFIQAVDERFCRLPGKVVVGVTAEKLALSFEKRMGEWGLWFSDEENPGNPVNLAGASIDRKARAVPLVIRLISALRVEQKRLLESINDAHALLLRNSGGELSGEGK